MNKLKLKKDKNPSFTIEHKQVGIIGLISLIIYILYNIFMTDIYEYFFISINRQIFFSLAYIVLSIIIMILWLKPIRQSISDLKIDFRKKLKYTFIASALIILIQTVITIILVMAFNLETITNQTHVENSINSVFYLSILTTILFGPIVEEIIFRGVIFRFLRQRTYIIAYLLSAFIFAFIHFYKAVLINGDFIQLIFMIPFMIVGLGFCRIYEKTDNLLYPIFLHMIINSIAFIASA